MQIALGFFTFFTVFREGTGFHLVSRPHSLVPPTRLAVGAGHGPSSNPLPPAIEGRWKGTPELRFPFHEGTRKCLNIHVKDRPTGCVLVLYGKKQVGKRRLVEEAVEKWRKDGRLVVEVDLEEVKEEDLNGERLPEVFWSQYWLASQEKLKEKGGVYMQTFLEGLLRALWKAAGFDLVAYQRLENQFHVMRQVWELSDPDFEEKYGKAKDRDREVRVFAHELGGRQQLTAE
uniref:Uncharacterized protein n=1 Tax=Chromera velia CCMP2878 TaxID=1169474 RepID=A0A0G4HW76_9ALVE|eukprot:Cvel_9001.t1-p1 / transcript=Cvel_9001.t1 / gene=Cvel_9001 / organism=Chromera_velia_CCMP2878 / gene_product=hypothetical protein / transcript_product=hypothetical protein / location=Cvel_scaffold509:52953-53642(+) / protein_length=230 / sequence_SO=supercontig / SO=protein_coding / is_pseudo=false